MKSLAKMSAALCGAVCAMSPLPANAQPIAPESAHAFTDQLIDDAKVRDLFENITTSGLPKALHKASGLVCMFPAASSGSSIRVYDSPVRGSDVSCGSHPAGMALTMFAVRPPRPLTLQQALAQYIAEVRTLHPDARPTGDKDLPPVAGLRGGDIPDWMIARFQFAGEGGGPVYSRLAVAIVDGWVIEQRLTTYPDQDWKAADRLGEGAMVVTLQEMTQRRQAPR